MDRRQLCSLTELYSYTEGPEFLMNRKCFEEDFRIHGKTISLTSRFPIPSGQHRTSLHCLIDVGHAGV